MNKIDLYTVSVTVKKYYHLGWRYNDVLIYLCKSWQQTNERCSSDYIASYHRGCTAEQYVSELFSLEEAQQLKHYWDSLKANCIITPVELPVSADSISYAMVYPDEFNSRCSFTVLGTIPFSVDGYCNVDDSMREPESDDFKILTTPELKNEKCFFCEQQISEQSKSGVVVMLNGRTYGCLCKMCAEWNAPELQKQLAINV